MLRKNTLRIRLASDDGGLEWFRVRGVAMGMPVLAEWDGQVLVIDRTFLSVLEVSMKVQSAFVQCGVVKRPEGLVDDPYRVAVELLRSLDLLWDVDYASHVRRARPIPLIDDPCTDPLSSKDQLNVHPRT